MKLLAVWILALSLMATASASPGAHGPNGEHLDEHASTAAAGPVPTVETFTELFELVGTLSGQELSIMIDRYETNEPVLNGKLEVEYKGMKAVAKFHPDMGDYAVEDEKFVKALAAPGKHALVFTLIAGEDSDLLEGTLNVAAVEDGAHAEHRDWKRIALYIITALVGAALAVFFIRRRNGKVSP